MTRAPVRWLRACPLAALVALAALAGCAAEPLGVAPLRAGPEASRAGVQALLDELVEADNADDAARVAALYTEDAVQLPWNGPAVIGRPLIESRYAEVFAAVDLDLRLVPQEIVAAEGWGYVLGSTHVTLAPRAGGAALRRDDKFVMIVRHEADGWRIARLAWSPLEGP